MKRFYEQGKLEGRWVEEYCKGDYRRCVRYWLEEKGEPHPDNMLPNGEIRQELKWLLNTIGVWAREACVEGGSSDSGQSYQMVLINR